MDGNGANTNGDDEPPSNEKRELLALLKLMKKYNLKQTEELLCQEANLCPDEVKDITESDIGMLVTSALGETLTENPNNVPSLATVTILGPAGNNLGSSALFSAVESSEDDDLNLYTTGYEELRAFVEDSLDIYKHELALALYPILVQIYFKLVASGQYVKARAFVEKFGPDLDHFYRDDLQNLLLITKPSDLESNELVCAMESEKFIIRMSRDSHALFKRHIQDRRQELIADIVVKYIHFDTYEGTARSKAQCQATAGAQIGEAKRQDNKIRVYYGLLKEIDLQSLPTQPPAPEEEDDDPDAPDKPKKKKPKKDPLFSKKSKSDPNAPTLERIPLPELKDSDKVLKVKALREATKRITLNKDSLPSVCFYTLLNGQYLVTCAEISDDSSMLAIGTSDSAVRIWSLTPSKLRELKVADELRELDKETGDIAYRMLDDRTGDTVRNLYGHCATVYRCAFAPELNFLLSCSEDTTIRLWSLLTWTCVVIYRGHLFPVWDVRFSPHGYYFASCSYDKTARLWATDANQPLRIFCGHLSDVDCVQFHPNSNYIASGSSDKTVRLWDVLNGQMVRLMTGHKATVHSLAFSMCGRYLASGSADHNVLIWDLSHGQLVTTLVRHHGTIHTLAFSRDGNLLAIGGQDCILTLWDFSKLTEDYLVQPSGASQNHEINDGEAYLLRAYPTKSTPFLSLHFTRRNLLLAVGIFKG